MMKPNFNVMFVCFIVFCCILGFCQAGALKKNFYQKTCPQAELIVKTAIVKAINADPDLPADLLRLHFHDCFVRGCDGSNLINSTKNNKAEKDAPPNLTLEGFDVIEAVKAKLEKACPGVVSCADVVALSARDAVSAAFKKPLWEVYTGRRDGTVSLASDALANLPPPTFGFAQLQQSFAKKGLTVRDLVVLSGAHTIGRAHCAAFRNRLFNFTQNGGPDPTLNPSYATFLRSKCASSTDTETEVDMDPNDALTFNNHYYRILKQNKGLFQSDAALLTNTGSNKIVQELLNSNIFFKEFATSMVKMGAIEVLTGSKGQIRKVCSVVNS